jgi:signal transduction histidine kinase
MSPVSWPTDDGSVRKAPSAARTDGAQPTGEHTLLTARERDITIEFLRLVKESTSTRDLIRAATGFFQQRSGCEAVGVRLQEGEDYPYFETRGFPQAFVLAENSLCAQGPAGEIQRDNAGHPVLDCMCGNVICGRFDPTKPFFTQHGSFWTNHTTQLLASTTEADRQARTRNRCNGEGYESVALIPLRFGKQRLGLLQLNDRRTGAFSPELISFWERLADQLAVALAKFRADEAQHESEASFRSLFDNMAEGFAYCRMIFEQGQPQDFIYLAVNKAFESRTGLKNVVGRKASEVIPGIRESDPLVFEVYGRVAASGQPEKFETCVKALQMWFSVSAYCPAPGHFVAVFDVITARKQAEQEMRAQRDLLEAMSRMAKVGGWGFDAATGQGTWTNEVARIHDLDPKVEPSVQFGLDFYQGRSRQMIKAAVHEAVTLGKPYDLELEILTAKGNHKWVRTFGMPIWRDSRVVEVHGAIQDITEQKRAEEETRRLNAELEQRVRDRTAQLEAANKELEAFSYSVSHDLRAPLRAIDGFASVLADDHASQLDSEGLRVLGVIRKETARMGHLINDLLAFARASRGEMRSVPIDLSALAQTVFDECASLAPKRKIRLKLEPPLPAQGDPSLIRQVLTNLLSDAIKYTKPREMAEIELGCRVDGSEHVYWIKDNGVGFDPRYSGKLFGIFQRLHREEEFEGTGVGLALVQRIIHRHGGRVWAEGRQNEGATFFFTLPIGHK